MVKRRKIRKGKDEDSPSDKRIKEKNGEVALARGRLAGALKGILNRNTDDSDEQESSCSFSLLSNSNSKKLTRDSSPAYWKKQNNRVVENEDHQSYFMKLFDRKVDLAQFDVNTPLYPLCRAWIQNKPLYQKKREDGLVEIKHDSEDKDSQLFDLNDRHSIFRSESSDIHNLPPPKPLPEGVHTLRIPSPVHREIQEINLNLEPGEEPTREELMTEHLKNWTSVRKRWRVASQKNESRYAASKKVLSKMYEKAQIQFNSG